MNKGLQKLLDMSKASLLRNKGRTFLSVVGVMIGIATVVAILSAGESIKALVTGQVTMWGTDFVQVEVKVPSTSHASTENATGQAQGVTITTLTIDDAQAVAKLSNINDFYAAMLAQKITTYQNTKYTSYIFGSSASFINIDPQAEVVAGRFYSEEEDKSQAKVVVLAHGTALELFGDQDPIEKSIKIGRDYFRVVGVLKERGASIGFDMNKMIYMPIRTVQKQLLGVDYVSFIFFQVKDVTQSQYTAVEVADILRDRHDIEDPNKDDFAVTTPEDALSILGGVSSSIAILLLLIGSISLLVGSVGIMNIMLVSVTERTQEIGLRKAVGATPKNIHRQFLTESVLITLLGGFLGMILGTLLILIVALIANKVGLDWQLSIQLRFYLLATSVSVVVGLLAGYYPAKKAAKLDPIVALVREV